MSLVESPLDVLPPKSGFADVIFRPEVDSGSWQHGEVRHERETVAAINPSLEEDRRAPTPALTEDQKKAFGYPEYPKEFDDPSWLRAQFDLEAVDPRLNPNLLLSDKDPEFWHNAMRKPYAKAIVKSERHWVSRKSTWLSQYHQIEELNQNRAALEPMLNACSIEVKRILTPILRYKITELLLANSVKEAQRTNMTLKQLMDQPGERRIMMSMRQKIDANGASAAEQLLEEYHYMQERNTEAHRKKLQLESRQKGKQVADMETLKDSLNLANKCKVDGMLEWQKGNHQEALESWREADARLSQWKAPDEYKAENKTIDELHGAVLRNLAQAAIAKENWTEALDVADRAIEIDEDDHKAWFRRACALEGAGRIDEIEACLEHIEDIATGRPDCTRIRKDTHARREKVRIIRERGEAAAKHMLQKGINNSVFSDERKSALALEDTDAVLRPGGPPSVASYVKPAIRLDEEYRKRITKDGAWDLLENLQDAYEDSLFRAQVKKLSRDVNFNRAEFVAYLSRLSLPIQKPVLEKWGFDPTEDGVTEMTKAIQDHTRGSGADTRLRAKAEEVIRVLYGEMFECTRPPSQRTGDNNQTKPSLGDGDSDDEPKRKRLGQFSKAKATAKATARAKAKAKIWADFKAKVKAEAEAKATHQ